MANIYEFEVNRDIVETLISDTGLLLASESNADLVDNLMSRVDTPTTYQKASMDGKPGFLIRVGKIQTERLEGQGLHIFNHSGSEGFLDMLEFDSRLTNSMKRHGIIFANRTVIQPEKTS